MYEEVDKEIVQTMQDMLEKLEEIKLSILMMRYSMNATTKSIEPSFQVEGFATTREANTKTTTNDTREKIHSAAEHFHFDKKACTSLDIDKLDMIEMMKAHQLTNTE